MEQANKKVVKAICETPNFYTIGPFVTTSGRLIPIYPDCRKIFSSPRNLRIIAKETAKLVRRKKIKFDIILGGATAGIQIATATALEMGKPLGYVRGEAKKGGLSLAVEGNWKPGMRALIIDDASAHGQGKMKFIRNVRRAGMKVSAVIAIVSRSRTNKSDRAWIKKAGVRFFDFCDLNDILSECRRRRIVSGEAKNIMTWFSKDSANWFRDKKKWKYFQDYKKMKKRNSKSGI